MDDSKAARTLAAKALAWRIFDVVGTCFGVAIICFTLALVTATLRDHQPAVQQVTIASGGDTE